MDSPGKKRKPLGKNPTPREFLEALNEKMRESGLPEVKEAQYEPSDEIHVMAIRKREDTTTKDVDLNDLASKGKLTSGIFWESVNAECRKRGISEVRESHRTFPTNEINVSFSRGTPTTPKKKGRKKSK